MPCKKANYPSKKNAMKAVRVMQGAMLYKKGKFIKRAKSAYICKKCGNWHITSSK